MPTELNDELNEINLSRLIERRIKESKTVEYKLKLSGDKRKDRIEFLSDISSFANTIGGTCYFGVKEEKGIASEIN